MKIVKTQPHVWKFPRHIDFESVSGYQYRIRQINLGINVNIDLSDTETVHSSFIGFLIDLKMRLEREGGGLNLWLSPQLERHFSRINLQSHFLPEAIPKAI